MSLTYGTFGTFGTLEPVGPLGSQSWSNLHMLINWLFGKFTILIIYWVFHLFQITITELKIFSNGPNGYENIPNVVIFGSRRNGKESKNAHMYLWIAENPLPSRPKIRQRTCQIGPWLLVLKTRHPGQKFVNLIVTAVILLKYAKTSPTAFVVRSQFPSYDDIVAPWRKITSNTIWSHVDHLLISRIANYILCLFCCLNILIMKIYI